MLRMGTGGMPGCSGRWLPCSAREACLAPARAGGAVLQLCTAWLCGRLEAQAGCWRLRGRSCWCSCCLRRARGAPGAALAAPLEQAAWRPTCSIRCWLHRALMCLPLTPAGRGRSSCRCSSGDLPRHPTAVAVPAPLLLHGPMSGCLRLPAAPCCPCCTARTALLSARRRMALRLALQPRCHRAMPAPCWIRLGIVTT